tara:strand:- start:356 stop:1246 length:891 start_codon:yes stop_codon:yes gene_type:complete
MKKNKIYILEDRGLLYVQGDDVKEFLQNIISNDIHKVTDSFSCYASLLTPQGKYLFDFIVLKHKKGYFIDCNKKQINQLYEHLNLYKLRSKVEILNLSNEFVVAAITREKFLSIINSKDEAGFTTKYREDPILIDPRNKELGARLVVNLEKLYLSVKKLELKSSESDEYYNFSHKLGIPQLDTDKLQNKLFGIECNFDELNGLDFKKGCYVGQENTARIKLRNKLAKRIMPIQTVQGKVKVDESIYINDENIGKILINNNYPFGLIKFKNGSIDFSKEYTCGSSKIKIIKPSWLKS